MARTGHAFTLIELITVIAIIAILAAVAVPNYTQYVTRTNRSAAQTLLHDVSNLQARYLVDARRYATTLAQLGITVPADVATNYTVTLATDNGATPPAWTVTATPASGQATQDARCGVLTLNQAGVKTVGGSGTVTACWGGR